MVVYIATPIILIVENYKQNVVIILTVIKNYALYYKYNENDFLTTASKLQKCTTLVIT